MASFARAPVDPVHRSALAEPHALVGQFLHRLLVLGKMRQPHSAQDVRRLGELDVVVAYDLDTVAPRVEEIKKLTRQWIHARVRQGAADGILVIDHESKMTAVVGRLLAALLEGEELIT